MLRSKWTVCLLAVIVATVAIAVVPYGVSADDNPAGLLGMGPGPMGPGAMFKKFLSGTPLGRHTAGSVGRGLVLISELNVTDEQKEQIRNVIVGHKSEIVEMVKTLHAKKCALHDAVMTENPDESAIRKAARERAPQLDVADRVVRSIHKVVPRRNWDMPLWIMAGLSATAATVAVLLAVQAVGQPAGSWGDLFDPITVVMR